MNKIFKIVGLFLLLIFLASCKSQAPAESESAGKMQESEINVVKDDQEGHIGCQENEISKNGECIPSDTNNASIFDTDTSTTVDTININNGSVIGYVAKPKLQGAYPGVLMIHEWWGLNDNIKKMAEILANEGYVVFAIDLYDGVVAQDSSKAGELASSVRANPEAAVIKMEKALDYLKNNYNITKIASLGWCFGGGQSLNIALNSKLDATVIYYGQLTNDKEKLKNITWPVLGIFGGKDTGIPVDSVNAFKTALDGIGVTNEIKIYENVGHAFANPTSNNYAPSETKDAWDKTIDFLNLNLK